MDRVWEKLEKLPAWQMIRVKIKTRVVLEPQREKRTVHVVTLKDICHLKCGAGAQISEIERPGCTPM